MNLAWVNYHHLYYFYIIAKEGSIARAAEKLRLGQPTLSSQLKLLEDSLESELFERKKQRLHLTEAGKTAYKYAEQIFLLGDELVAALKERRPNSRIQLRIGALDSVPKSIIEHVMAKALEADNCSISVFEGQGQDLFHDLMGHRLDLLLTNYPASIDKHSVYAKKIARYNVMICAAPEFKHLKKDFPQSLHRQPFVLPTSHSHLRKDLDHFFHSHEIQVDRIAETQDTSLQEILGKKALGLIPLNELSAKELVKRKELVILGKLPGVYEEIFLLAADRKIKNTVAASLMSMKDLLEKL